MSGANASATRSSTAGTTRGTTTIITTRARAWTCTRSARRAGAAAPAFGTARPFAARNYKTWKVVANGPIRAIFELTYETWDASGVFVAETKRFTVDAGHNLDRIDSTFAVAGAKEITIAVGLNKKPADKGQDEKISTTPTAGNGSITQWIVQKTNGDLGTAIILPTEAFGGFTEDASNQLALAKVAAGGTLTYYAGAGWSKAGDFTSEQAWSDYVAACAQRARAPVQVKLSVQ